MILDSTTVGRVGVTALDAATIQRPGGTVKTIAVVRRPDAVAVLPIRVHAGVRQVLLVQQPRPVVGEPHLVEVVAGTIDPGESITGTAVRELREETGLVATGVYWLAAGLCVSPGYTTERMHVFAATVADTRVTQRIEDAGITSRWLPLDEVSTQDMKTVVAVALAERDTVLWEVTQ